MFDFMDGRGGGKRDGYIEWKEFVPLVREIHWDRRKAQAVWSEIDRSGERRVGKGGVR